MRNFVQLLARRTQGKLESEAEEDMGFITDAAQRIQQMLISRADSAEGRRPSTGPEKRSAPRAGQRLGGAVARRWRPLARSLRDRPRLLSGASELRVSGEQVFMTDPTLCYNTVGLSSRIGGWGGRKRASFL